MDEGRAAESGSRPHASTPSGSLRGYDGTDWLACAVTFGATLVLYLCTITPAVALGFAGIFATAALHGGVSHPPGYPLWTVYAWPFVHFLPGTIGWRAAVASSVAAAASCGSIALIVSWASAATPLLARPPVSLQPIDWRLRVVCGFVGGGAFGFNTPFWHHAVVGDVWTLSTLLMCVVLALFARWNADPERTRYLYAAFFVYGLTLTNSQILLCLAPAIPFLVLPGSLRVSRDLFIAAAALSLWLVFGALRRKSLFPLDDLSFFLPLILPLAAVTCGMALILIRLTRSLLTEWRTLMIAGACTLLGLSLYLYVPLVSMTNPPMNWGYPRTMAGFIHTVGRGQYMRIAPVKEAGRFLRQVKDYFVVASRDFGWIYFPPVLLLFASFHRLAAPQRVWFAGMAAAYVCLAFLMVAVLNPAPGEQRQSPSAVLYSASYIPLAIFCGCGLALGLTRLQNLPRGKR